VFSAGSCEEVSQGDAKFANKRAWRSRRNALSSSRLCSFHSLYQPHQQYGNPSLLIHQYHQKFLHNTSGYCTMAPKATEPASRFAKDEKVLCFHHEMLYEAKVLDFRMVPPDSWQFKIHYKGWKNTVSFPLMISSSSMQSGVW
jgi:hypothetical protein